MVRQRPGAVVPVISHTRLIRGDGQVAQQRCPGCPQVRGSPGGSVTDRQMPDGILVGAAIGKAAGKGR